jgi:hypothetical protein
MRNIKRLMASGASCPSEGGFNAGDKLSPYTISGVQKLLDSSSATSVTIKGLENYRAYNVGVVAVDDFGNPSVISDKVCAIPMETQGYEPDVDGGYCFIATAAFGSYSHPTVKILRKFRDRFLSRIPGGNFLIASYYKAGPSLAKMVNDNSTLKNIVVILLTLFAGFSVLLMSVGPLAVICGIGGSISLGLLIGLLLPWRRNR